MECSINKDNPTHRQEQSPINHSLRRVQESEPQESKEVIKRKKLQEEINTRIKDAGDKLRPKANEMAASRQVRVNELAQILRQEEKALIELSKLIAVDETSAACYLFKDGNILTIEFIRNNTEATWVLAKIASLDTISDSASVLFRQALELAHRGGPTANLFKERVANKLIELYEKNPDKVKRDLLEKAKEIIGNIDTIPEQAEEWYGRADPREGDLEEKNLRRFANLECKDLNKEEIKNLLLTQGTKPPPPKDGEGDGETQPQEQEDENGNQGLEEESIKKWFSEREGKTIEERLETVEKVSRILGRKIREIRDVDNREIQAVKRFFNVGLEDLQRQLRQINKIIELVREAEASGNPTEWIENLIEEREEKKISTEEQIAISILDKIESLESYIEQAEVTALHLESSLNRFKRDGPRRLLSIDGIMQNYATIFERADRKAVEAFLFGSKEEEHKLFNQLIMKAEVDPAQGFQESFTLLQEKDRFVRLVQLKYAVWLTQAGEYTPEEGEAKAVYMADYFQSMWQRRKRWSQVNAITFFNPTDIKRVLAVLGQNISPEDLDILASGERPLTPLAVQAYISGLHLYLNTIKQPKYRQALSKYRQNREQVKQELKKELKAKKIKRKKFGGKVHDRALEMLSDDEQRILEEGVFITQSDAAPNRTRYGQAQRKKEYIRLLQIKEQGGSLTRRQEEDFEEYKKELIRRGQGAKRMRCLSEEEEMWLKSEGKYSPIEVFVREVLETKMRPQVRKIAVEEFIKKHHREPNSEELSRGIEVKLEDLGYQVHEAILSARTRAVGTLDLSTFVANWTSFVMPAPSTLAAPPAEDLDRILNGEKMIERLYWFGPEKPVEYQLSSWYIGDLCKKAAAIGILNNPTDERRKEAKKRWKQVFKDYDLELPEDGVIKASGPDFSVERRRAAEELMWILEDVTGIEYDFIMKSRFNNYGGIYHISHWRYQRTVRDALIKRVEEGLLPENKKFAQHAVKFAPAVRLFDSKEAEDRAKIFQEAFDIYPILAIELLPKQMEELGKTVFGDTGNWGEIWKDMQKVLLVAGSEVSNRTPEWFTEEPMPDLPVQIEDDGTVKVDYMHKDLVGGLLEGTALEGKGKKVEEFIKRAQGFMKPETIKDPKTKQDREAHLEILARMPFQYSIFHSMTPFSLADNNQMGGQASMDRRLRREATTASQVNEGRNKLLGHPSPEKWDEIYGFLAEVEKIADYTTPETGHTKVMEMADINLVVNKARYLVRQGIPLWEAVADALHGSENEFLKKFFPSPSKADEWFGPHAPNYLPPDIRYHLFQMQRLGLIETEQLQKLMKAHKADFVEAFKWTTYQKIPSVLFFAILAYIVYQIVEGDEEK